VKSGAEILSAAEGIISVVKQRLVQLEPILTDAQSMTHNLRGASKNLPEIVNELQVIIDQVKTALSLINGELHEIPGVAIDAKRALSKTDQLLDSVQDIWPLSSNKPMAKQLIEPHSNYD
jgi:ABC-type transporter Mla subunit MlaD